MDFQFSAFCFQIMLFRFLRILQITYIALCELSKGMWWGIPGKSWRNEHCQCGINMKISLLPNCPSKTFKLWSSSARVRPAPSTIPLSSTLDCFNSRTQPPYNNTSDWLNMPTLICQAELNNRKYQNIVEA